MYQLRIVAVEVLGIIQVSAALRSDSGDEGRWETLATVTDDVPCSEEHFHDPLSSMLDAVRLWSEMTIQR